MTCVGLVGAGAGGAAAAAELELAGHEVRWWNRTPRTIEPFRAHGVSYEGVLGEGVVRPTVVDDVGALIEGSDVIVVCLPSLAHESVALTLARQRSSGVPVVLNPGHTGGALHFAEIFRSAGCALPPLAELSTLTYVARKPEPHRVRISGVARRVHGAALPGGEKALRAAQELFPAVAPAGDVLATSFANVNLVLHAPGAILSAAWVEATHGDFRFYVDAMTPGVARTIEALDAERLAVAAAFGHELPALAAEMAAIGTAEAEYAAHGDTRSAIATGAANREIRAPDSLDHRYYREDLAFGIVPLLELAAIAGVRAPLAGALVDVGTALLGADLRRDGLTAERLGIAGLDLDEVLERVRAETGAA